MRSHSIVRCVHSTWPINCLEKEAEHLFSSFLLWRMRVIARSCYFRHRPRQWAPCFRCKRCLKWVDEKENWYYWNCGYIFLWFPSFLSIALWVFVDALECLGEEMTTIVCEMRARCQLNGEDFEKGLWWNGISEMILIAFAGASVFVQRQFFFFYSTCLRSRASICINSMIECSMWNVWNVLALPNRSRNIFYDQLRHRRLWKSAYAHTKLRISDRYYLLFNVWIAFISIQHTYVYVHLALAPSFNLLNQAEPKRIWTITYALSMCDRSEQGEICLISIA